MLSVILDRLIERIPRQRIQHSRPDPLMPARMRILPTFLFDEAFYLKRYDLEIFHQGDALTHYLTEGIPAGAWPNRWFDPEHYYSQFPGDPDCAANPLLHYIEKGAALNAPTCAGFSDTAGTGGKGTPLSEFIRTNEGRLAGRDFVVELENRSLMFEHGRYVFITTFLAYELGCRIHLRVSGSFVASCRRHRFHQAILDDIRPERLAEGDPYPNSCVVLADRPRASRATGVSKWIHLKRGRSNRSATERVFKPTMHPSVYRLGLHRMLRSARRRARDFRVMFSGNAGILYRNPLVSWRFGKVSRNRLIGVLRREFSDRINDLSSEEGGQGTVCIPQDIVLATDREVRIPSVDWLRFLSRSRFFICMPGAYFPMTHSVAECMAVGTIPILEFPELFSPGLEDGVHCIAFRGKAGFVRAIERALSMSDKEMEEMKQQVVKYYDAHLSFPAFLEGMLMNDSPDVSLVFPYEYPGR